ncbi:M85 family metallopeptidase, partial [Arsenophonus sp.]|uniref:M85 family metallopeptidase n=1 Tax=Arsenophonus sp. TaxID=1872640 RepID=UPI003879C7CF
MRQPNPAHETFRRSDGYAPYVITIGESNRLSEAQLYDIIVGVRQSIRQSYCFLAEPYTAFAIEDTIRTATLLSQTFRNILAFSVSPERRNTGILYSYDITSVNYRNFYVMRQYTDRRRLDQLSLTEILTTTAETVPIVPQEALMLEDARDPDFFVSTAIAADYNSVYYPFWQTGVIHEIIHAITDAGDPPVNEQTTRLGPTVILTHQIAREMLWNIPVFTAYNSVDRNTFIYEYQFQSLRHGIYRHHQRGYELLERLCDINHLLTSSPNFAGIDTLSDECLIPTHSSEEDTPAHWGAFLLGGAHATHQRKDVFATKHKNIVFNKEELPLTQWNLEKYGLVIAEKVVNRVEHGSGFYKKKYKSWKEWYQSLAWKHMLGYGIHGYGQAEAEGY